MRLQDQLDGILNDASMALTESSLIIGAIALLLTGLITNRPIVLKAVFVIVVITAFFLNHQVVEEGVFLSQSLFVDAEIIGFTSLFLLLGLLILLFQRKHHCTEFYFLILSLLVGSVFMMKANSLLLIYLAVELVSFTSYILTGFSFKKEGFEASIKYLLFGAVSTAIMLVGLGLIYGTSGIFYLTDLSSQSLENVIQQVGFLFVLFGILFKVAIFPFHIWTPATYQFAPIDSVAIFSVVPKIAGLILLNRLLIQSGLDYMHWTFALVLILGISTIIIGTLGALRQVDARRMISFGSISHSGFLLGFVLMPTYNPEAFWIYAVIYGVMNYGAFYMLEQYESFSIYNINDYSRSRNEVLVGGVFTLILVSLVGLPPLAGFTAKLFLFSTLWESFQHSGFNAIGLYLVISVIATVASLFFYFKIPRNIFLSREGHKTAKDEFVFSFKAKIIATIFAITLLMLFFVPKLIISLQLLLNNGHE